MKNMVKNNKIKWSLALVAIGMSLLAVIAFGNHSNLFAPENADNASLLNPFVSEPVFSNESGFYDQAFYLELSSSPNTKIYYTLDCSQPDENSIEYKEPILVENVSEHPNTYSMLTNISVGFYHDLIEKHQTLINAPAYVAPDYPVKKCMVVRAIAVDEKGNCSDVKTNSYFVEKDLSFFQDCNIISVVTSPENLFDDVKGIYVTGDVFDDYMYKKKVAAYWELWQTNYTQSGKEWERPVDFVCFNSEGETLLSASGRIQIQGGISRGALPRSLNLHVDEKHVDTGIINGQLFQPGFSPTKLTLSAGGNERTTVIKDYMVCDRTQALSFSKMAFKPYVLFLEGEYWGFYWLTTAYNERYLSYHYGVEEDNIVMVKNGDLKIGNDIDILFYDNMKKYITENDMSVAAHYQRACELIDIDNFLDYYACMAYIARNGDWPSSNYALWRTRTVENNEYADGKWRWMLFDCNSSSMTTNLITHDTLNYIIATDAVFRSLWNNQGFRLAFQERILKIADECFDAQEMSDYIDQYTQCMLPTLKHSWDRFYGTKNVKERNYYLNLEQHKEFFNARRDVVASWFE